MAEIIKYIEEDWASGPVRYPLIQCGCGAEVHCTNSWANECDCGAEYNRFGQQLADRDWFTSGDMSWEEYWDM